jgi:hypothetical protein
MGCNLLRWENDGCPSFRVLCERVGHHRIAHSRFCFSFPSRNRTVSTNYTTRIDSCPCHSDARAQRDRRNLLSSGSPQIFQTIFLHKSSPKTAVLLVAVWTSGRHGRRFLTPSVTPHFFAAQQKLDSTVQRSLMAYENKCKTMYGPAPTVEERRFSAA